MSKQIIPTLAVLVILIIAGWYINRVAGEELTASIKFSIQLTTLILTMGFIVGLLAWGWIAFERARTESEHRLEAQARRRLVERESDVFVVVAKRDEQVHIRELSKEALWRPAHLDPRIYANGQQTLPNGLEVASWAAWQQGNRPGSAPMVGGEPLIALEAGSAGPGQLPSLVRWFDLLPNQRGDLHNLVLGVRLDEAGRLVPVTISLYDLFHTLVAASTGWGKSAFVNSILAQLATCHKQVEFVLIDPQEHGLAPFKNCDRLRYPLLRQPHEILDALHAVYDEATQHRSELFARYDADDLEEYNRLAEEYLPPIIVAVDEASTLLAHKEIGAELKRHTWELRKFGVYQILLLTSAKGVVIDTDHRQQFASKVQLHANERGQARLLMDAPEAITFPPGRAMLDLPGQAPIVVQAPYIDKREVRALLRPATSPPPSPPTTPVTEQEPEAVAEQKKDQLFKQLVAKGWSRNAASLEAYGRRYAGNLVERGKRVLGEL